jgi:4-hydroxy-3-methylbut-2-enyl diphosphate reductase
MRNLQIIRSAVLGYCAGVSQAVKMAESLADRNALNGNPIYTYGPIVHNKDVLDKLKQKRVYVLDEKAFLDPGNDLSDRLRGIQVILRAHGVSPHIEARLQEAGAVIQDATCQKVKATQLLVQKLSAHLHDSREDAVDANNATDGGVSPAVIFLAGDRDHAEIRGILGYAPDCVCVSTEAEAEEAARSRQRADEENAELSAVLIGQTTLSMDDYRKIAAVLQKYYRLDVKNTICPATAYRQNALRELCARVDAVIVAGGKSSANTRTLADIARSTGKPTYLLENASEVGAILPELTAHTTIGLAAGASTPIEIIEELESRLRLV